MLKITSSHIKQSKYEPDIKEFKDIINRFKLLERRLEAATNRDDKRTLKLAKWFDEYHMYAQQLLNELDDSHHISLPRHNHRSEINNIK